MRFKWTLSFVDFGAPETFKPRKIPLFNAVTHLSHPLFVCSYPAEKKKKPEGQVMLGLV